MSEKEKEPKNALPKELRELELEDKSERAGNEAYKLSSKRKWIERGALVLSGVVYSAAFPSWNMAFLGWVALIPLFLIVLKKTPWQAWRAGYLWGFAWSSAAFFWLGEIESFNPPFRALVLWTKAYFPSFNGGFCLPWLMALILALFTAFWAMFVPILRRGLLIPIEVQLKGSDAENEDFKKSFFKEIFFVFALACWWCILEWVRTWIATGLPWNFLAATQWKNTPLLQICEYTGIYGVSFLIALVNISLALAMLTYYRVYTHGGKYRRPFPFIISMVLIMLCVLIGSRTMMKYKRMKQGIRFRAAVLQGDIPQCRGASDEEAKYALDKYLKMSEKVIRKHEKMKDEAIKRNMILSQSNSGKYISVDDLDKISALDIIIWPETAVPLPYRSSHYMCMDYRFRLDGLIKKYKIPFLIGSIDFSDYPVGPNGEYAHYNSALFINRKGELADSFAKVHIVPFGEFVPFSDTFPFLERMIGMGRNLSRGKDFHPIEIAPGVRAGVGICFEDVFPYVARNETKEGANLLVVITNDAWYPTSSEPEQHLANSVFRAVENRRPMIRCGNNSATCLISPTGLITDSITKKFSPKLKQDVPDPCRREEGSGIFTLRIEPDPPLTFYSRFGDVFILVCWAIFGAAAIFSLWTWREKKQALVDKFGAAKS